MWWDRWEQLLHWAAVSALVESGTYVCDLLIAYVGTGPCYCGHATSNELINSQCSLTIQKTAYVHFLLQVGQRRAAGRGAQGGPPPVPGALTTAQQVRPTASVTPASLSGYTSYHWHYFTLLLQCTSLAYHWQEFTNPHCPASHPCRPVQPPHAQTAPRTICLMRKPPHAQTAPCANHSMHRPLHAQTAPCAGCYGPQGAARAD